MTADELRAIVERDAAWGGKIGMHSDVGVGCRDDRRALLALLQEVREALGAYGDWRHHDDELALALARLASLDPTETPTDG